jgi:toxin ParE1/3/4
MVTWTRPATADLKAIHDFIAPDSKYYAKTVTRDIIRKADILNEFPKIGRVVPETDDENIREVFAYSYRIVYEIKSDIVYILAIIHGKRDFGSTHLHRIQEPNASE